MDASIKTVVITGSTRGIGFGLAREFLKRGCRVVISGRNQASVDKVVAELSAQYATDAVCGHACDVADYEQLRALWSAAVAHFDRVDYWINNAGMDLPRQSFWQLTPAQIQRIISVNLLGVMYASHIVVGAMLKQGGGQLFNMEGFGSEGRMSVGITAYGTTKYGLRYFTRSLQKELKGTPIIVGTLSPGIVITDLLMDAYKDRPDDLARAKRFFNILGDHVETVTPYLAQKLLENTAQGAHIAWLTPSKIFWRFLKMPLNKRDLFAQ